MPTFYHRFRECADRWPDNPALEIQKRDELESYTYAQVRQNAECVGRWLIDSGYEPGTRIALLADNHPRWVMAYLGAIAAGCTAVPLDTAFHTDQVAKLLNDSGASILVCDQKHLPTAQAAVTGLPVRLLLTTAPATDNLDAIFSAGSAQFIPADVPSDSVAAILYTSGTTADPKGVMLTHANLMGEATGVFALFHLGPEDALLGLLPLFHSLAQMANLLLPLVSGSRVVYLETLNTTELLRALRERHITTFCVVPQFFYLIHERIFKEVAQRGKFARIAFNSLRSLNRNLRKLGLNAGRIFFRPIHQTFGAKMRYLVTGGSRFDPQIARDFHDLGIDVLQAYGLTETCGGACVTPPGDIAIGSVGRPLPGTEVRIVDPEPQETGPDVGEIAIRGPIVMKGYWNRPDATAAILKDGWLYTGDLGYMDSRGNIFITGRRKEVIVLSNGKNVYPEEIESHYLQSPYIKEICVLGIEGRPGDPSSEKLHAVVVPNFDVLRQRKIVNTREVIRFDIEGLSAKLASTKRIGSYEIWQEDLPRTTTRKLKRFEIAKRVGKGESQSDDKADRRLSPEDQAWLEDPDVQRALKIVGERAKESPRTIFPQDNLELDLGFDSMQRVELLTALEDELGGDIEESRASEIYTVRELVDAIRESASSTDGAKRTQFIGWHAVLHEDPTDPAVLTLARPHPVQEFLLRVALQLVHMVALDKFDLHVTGLEKLPQRGPFILSSNHQSYIDPFIMSSVLPRGVFNQLFSVGTSDIFGSKLMRRVARMLRVIVLDPDANLIPAMRAGAYGLRHGRVLILYPEGERSIDGTPRIFKKGAAILSTHLQVPIVPIAIEGFHDAWPRGKSFQKFTRLQISFGDPIIPPPEDAASEETYAQLTAELKSKVKSMWESLRRV
jgi:long-chain acyl-CoA synthetase